MVRSIIIILALICLPVMASGQGMLWETSDTNGGSLTTYDMSVVATNPTHYWPISDAVTSSMAADFGVGTPNPLIATNVTFNSTALGTDGATSAFFNGTSSRLISSSSASDILGTLTSLSWMTCFTTTQISFGRIFGPENTSDTTAATIYDKPSTYVNNDHGIGVGFFAGSDKAVSSASPYNNGTTHCAGAVWTSGSGTLTSVIDGATIGSISTGAPSALSATYWYKVGAGTGPNSTWPNGSATTGWGDNAFHYFNGNIAKVALWINTPITTTQLATLETSYLPVMPGPPFSIAAGRATDYTATGGVGVVPPDAALWHGEAPGLSTMPSHRGGTATAFTGTITNTNDQTLFLNSRCNGSANTPTSCSGTPGQPISYATRLSQGGVVTINLLFNEPVFTAAGQRVFNITYNVDGGTETTLFSNFDILKTTGPCGASTVKNRACEISATVNAGSAGDGLAHTLSVTFSPVTDLPLVNGVQFVPQTTLVTAGPDEPIPTGATIMATTHCADHNASADWAALQTAINGAASSGALWIPDGCVLYGVGVVTLPSNFALICGHNAELHNPAAIAYTGVSSPLMTTTDTTNVGIFGCKWTGNYVVANAAANQAAMIAQGSKHGEIGSGGDPLAYYRVTNGTFANNEVVGWFSGEGVLFHARGTTANRPGLATENYFHDNYDMIFQISECKGCNVYNNLDIDGGFDVEDAAPESAGYSVEHWAYNHIQWVNGMGAYVNNTEVFYGGQTMEFAGLACSQVNCTNGQYSNVTMDHETIDGAHASMVNASALGTVITNVNLINGGVRTIH